MADDGEHSLFSASGADGWSVCYGKPAMEEGRKGSTSYADEGTAAHDLAARVLRARIDRDEGVGLGDTAYMHIGEKITVARAGGSRTFTVSEDMAEHVDDYVDRCMAVSDGCLARGVEQRVSYDTHLGVDPSLAFGTTDFWALMPGGLLIIVDLKYGAGVMVYADGYQGRLYAAGSAADLDYLGDVKRVRIVILQPRKDWVDELELDYDALLSDVHKLRDAVPFVGVALATARRLRGEGKSDLEVGAELNDLGYLHTSDKGCRFCDAKAVCPAVIGNVTEAFASQRATADDFEDLTVDAPLDVQNYGGNYLTNAYGMLDAVEQWSKAVRAEIERRVLIHGEKFPGVKVVAGKRGSRRWADETDALLFIQKEVPVEHHAVMFKSSLLTPTQLEKALKNNPDTWAKLKPLITQDEGKPAVVPESDSRAPISHKAVADDFADETEQPARGRGALAGHVSHPFRD